MDQLDQLVTTSARLGILGGGQLGKMLVLAASHWHVRCHALDPDPACPAAHLVERFVVGNYGATDDVIAFGEGLELLTIEIEQVSCDALEALERRGVRVCPQPSVLRLIQDKGRQKEFYSHHGFPTASFSLFPSAQALRAAVASGEVLLPFVQKVRSGGYDGRGVQVVKQAEDLGDLLEGPCLSETFVDVAAELAVLVARSGRGEVVSYPPVEMAFDPKANLVEWLACPARIEPQIAERAREIALDLAAALQIEGLLAVELLLSTSGELLINEVSPRPHNSGHHTIESCFTSQYEQHLRAIYGLPLGSADLKLPAVMVNILGADGYEGHPQYQGLTECMALPGVKIHLYGKSRMRPGRKMGHATVLAHELDDAIATARRVRETIKVIARPEDGSES
jgi:5-(carboxyamino)imidazole ribonucleotide synthase